MIIIWVDPAFSATYTYTELGQILEAVLTLDLLDYALAWVSTCGVGD
jgi:hypothetical protein